MPIFLDRHDVGEATAEDIAAMHVRDMQIQDKYGVKFITYWYDAARRTTFCLVDAPDKATADKVHAEAHGHVSNQMIAVDLSAIEAFLGRVQDPPTAEKMAIEDSAFRAIMFTDMVGSTQMTEEIGDRMAVELLKAHDGIIRRTLERHRGSWVKHLGDGVMASFNHVPASVECAIELQEEFATYRSSAKIPIHVRIGIHAGEPVEESDDLFGSAVQLASRICHSAEPDGILVSGEIRNTCRNAAREFDSLGSRTLKGFSQPIELFSPVK